MIPGLGAVKAWAAGSALTIVGVVAAAGWAFSGVQTWKLHSQRTASAEKILALNTQIGAYTTKALEASDRIRTLEGQLETSSKENRDALAKEKANLANVAAAARAADADNGRLRDALGAYATGRGVAAPDTAVACRARAETLSQLLDESMRIQVEGVLDALDLAADYRALHDDGTQLRLKLGGWGKN